jgi:iron complex outermembrane recepter protein
VKPRAEDNVQEVVVTGTRIRDDDAGPAPVRVFSRGRIERYGVSSLADLSRYFTQQPFSFSEGYQPSGAQHFQMRGLGVDTTLVLINGRRAAPSANSISFNAFDLNTIPPAIVDRIEVMSDSASAIYGADAVGGVVNIILRDDIEHPEASLHFGDAAGGAEEQRVSAAIGSSSERLKSTLVFDYFERGELLGADRDLLRNQDFTRFGGTDYRLSSANPGNIYSLNGQALPGLMSPYAAVPIGSSGVGLTPVDFAATAGTRNLFSSYSVASVVPASTRTTGYGALEFELMPRLKLFGEVLISQSNIKYQQRLPTLSRELIPATNPFNPFGVPVAMDYAFAGVDPVSIDSDSELTRLVAGARGHLQTWDWEIAAVHSVEDSLRVTANDLDLSRVRAAIRSEDPSSALNLFRDGPAGSDELLASLVADPLRYHYSFGTSQLSGFFRGPLFQLPSGAAELVIGGEWRREEIEYFDRAQLTKERDVGSAFAEMKAPLLDNLSLKIALRGDHYHEMSAPLNPQYGLVWKPSNEWLLRATYGSSFRPPSLFELYQPRTESSFPVADARRGGAVTNLRFVIGGNPELDVVTARSFTTGFVFKPRDLPGVRLAGSYWRVVMDNRVLAPSIDLLNREDEFPGRITRAAPTPEDIQAGRPGALVSLDISKMNYGSLKTSGVDLEMSYLIERDRS